MVGVGDGALVAVAAGSVAAGVRVTVAVGVAIVRGAGAGAVVGVAVGSAVGTSALTVAVAVRSAIGVGVSSGSRSALPHAVSAIASMDNATSRPRHRLVRIITQRTSRTPGRRRMLPAAVTLRSGTTAAA